MPTPALKPGGFRGMGSTLAVLLAVVVAVLAAPANRLLAGALALLVAAGSVAIGLARRRRAGWRYQDTIPADVREDLAQAESDPPHALGDLGRTVNRQVGELRASHDEVTRRILDGSHDA